MKADVTKLAIKIHSYFMERKEYECQSVDDLIHIAIKMLLPEFTSDLRLIADAIDECSANWEDWTDSWKHGMEEYRSQMKYYNANRGEI